MFCNRKYLKEKKRAPNLFFSFSLSSLSFVKNPTLEEILPPVRIHCPLLRGAL